MKLSVKIELETQDPVPIVHRWEISGPTKDKWGRTIELLLVLAISLLPLLF